MQNRLVQSTCEAFAALEISDSRSMFQSDVSRTNSQKSSASSVLLPQNVQMNFNGFPPVASQEVLIGGRELSSSFLSDEKNRNSNCFEYLFIHYH